MFAPHRPNATWYEATATRGEPLPPLGGNADCDVCVIGGGLAGLGVALETARRGRSVVLLEAKRLAWGASGRNGGFVTDGFALGTEELLSRAGPGAARSLYRLSAEGSDYVRAKAALQDRSVHMGNGVVVAWRHPASDAARTYRDMMSRQFGVDLILRDKTATRKELRGERYFDSLFVPRGFHIHPLKYALGLAAEAQAAGARIYENCAAMRVESLGDGVRIRTGAGTVRAKHVVHCVSALGRGLHGPSGRAVLPVATYVAVTEPLTQDSIRTRSAIADTRRAGDYYRLIDNGRLLWGGRITTRVAEPARLAEAMKGDMLAVYPALDNPRIDYAWAGTMGYALHKMPLIGRGADGQWYATAFGGHGINTTAMAGMLLARAICERDDEYRRFEAFGPRWAGGPFGRIGVQASYWWMQAKDRRDEAKA